MTDVFVRFAPKSPLRVHLASAVVCRWLEELDVRLHCIFMEGTYIPEIVPILCEVQLPETDFHWTSRAYADQRAQTDPYIFADDDNLIIGENWVKRAIEVAVRHPEYALLSAMSSVWFERQVGGVEQGDLITEVGSVGANCVHRKGIINYARLDGPANHQDIIVCEELRKRGVKFAKMKDVVMNHLGAGFSQVTPELWNHY